MNHSIKLLAIDLDKTLLNDAHQLSSFNRAKLRHVMGLGVKVVLASGREKETIEQFATQIGTPDPIIACNGALICGPLEANNRSIWYHEPIPEGIVEEVYTLTQENQLCLTVHYPTCILAREENEFTQLYHNQTGATITYDPDWEQIIIGSQPTKLITIIPPEFRQSIFELYSEKWGNRVLVNRTNPEYVEINGKNVNKGKALEWLCERLQIPLEQTMAFGDNYGDQPMLERAGWKVLMKNAPKDVLHTLSHHNKDLIIAETNAENGVGKIIQRFFEQ